MKKSPKTRLDSLLVSRGLVQSKSSAAACVLAGRVFSGGKRLDKPGTAVRDDIELTLNSPPRYVSRGGVKLEGALDKLAIEVADTTWVDVGASTGGFTDCLLQRGAQRIYAVDVGKGQLSEKLRQDPRVINLESTNARHLQPGDFSNLLDGAVVDASFIGLGKLLPALARVLPEGSVLLAMVKPQFEAGKEVARMFRGVISDSAVRGAIIDRVKGEVAAQGFQLVDGCDSQLPGPKGNVEYFLLARRQGTAER